MRVVVTGGAGFLGSHLCDRLIQNGHEVTAVDDFYTGSKGNLRGLLGRADFELVEHDVRKPFDFKCDRLFHLACPASPVHYQRDPIRTTLTNVLGTLHALECAQKHGARFFLASTSEVYGDPAVSPQSEDYRGNVNPHGPRSCYDEGKRCAESLTMDVHRGTQLPVRIARIFNTYGPRMAFDDGRVVSNFIYQALRNHPITIYGDGTQTRSFCYVDDLIEGFIRLMEHSDETGPVNLGNRLEYTVKALAEEVLKLTGSKSELVFRPLPEDDPLQRRPDISLAQKRLGFDPSISLRDGLSRTIEDFRKRIEVAL